MKRVWKKYRNSNLELSNYGEARSWKTGQMVKKTLSKKSVKVNVVENKKPKVIVLKNALAELFNIKGDGSYIINVDGNPENCRIDNLRRVEFKPEGHQKLGTRSNNQDMRRSETLGEKIIRFDNSEGTVKEFNEIFNNALYFHDDNEEVVILDRITDTMRLVSVGYELLQVDLIEGQYRVNVSSGTRRTVTARHDRTGKELVIKSLASFSDILELSEFSKSTNNLIKANTTLRKNGFTITIK